MNNFNKLIVTLLVLLFPIIKNVKGNEADALNKKELWSQNQKGANIFNKTITRKDIQDAKSIGISFIRLSPDKFVSNHRDFLIGNANFYDSIPQEDFLYLKKILDMFWEEKMPVVITMLSLPLSYWNDLKQGKTPHHHRNINTPQFKILKDAFGI